MKYVAFITGTRADYGKLKSYIQILTKNKFDVRIFATGMHLQASHGFTVKEIERDFPGLVTRLQNHNAGDDQVTIITKTMDRLRDEFLANRPNCVVVHGDRAESLAASLVCSVNYIHCIHIEGGEVSGTLDEVYRHAITKLANTHLVSSRAAKNRVIRMGEPQSRVHEVGSPEFDLHTEKNRPSLSQVCQRYDISDIDYGILLFHSVTSELSSVLGQATEIASAIEASKKYFIVILPNNDPGSEGIRDIFLNNITSARILPNMRFAYFSVLLEHAQLIVGNSSCGVREAPFFGVQSVNLGTRQTNRNNSASIMNLPTFDARTLSDAICHFWGRRHPNSQTFGVGDSDKKVLALLQSDEFWNIPKQKYFSD